jgi:phosphate transport system substrate-binding protein
LRAERHGVTLLARPYLAEGMRVVAVEGYMPETQHVQSGAYPLSRPLILVVSRERGGAARQFVRFMLTPEGQRVVRRHFVAAW